MNFKEYKINDICKLINGRAYLMPELQHSGKYRIVRVGNFSGRDEWFYSDLELDNDKYCEKGDLLFKWACNFGPEIWDQEKVIYHYHIWKIICDESKVSKLYFFYYLKYFTPNLLGSTNGTTMVHITKESMERKKILIPIDPKTQQKIADILSKYDYLIENNNKRIKLLEQMAENLYKEWFVRFRFPNYKKTKFVKGIPEGWRFIKVLEITNLKSGYAFSSEDFSDINGDCAVAKIKDISGLFMDTNDFSYVNEEKCKNAKKFILNIGDLTIALTGATIGKIGIVPNFDKKIYTNQRLGKFFNGENPINNLPYLFCLFSQKQIQQNILNISNSSSAQPNISPEQIENIKILSNKSIIEQFNNYTKSIFEQMIKLHDINKNLIKQRDLLLPRLMSGKLEV